MQDFGKGLQPLAFFSKQLKPTKQRYSAYERELAAVVYCFQAWRHYLEGCPEAVTIMTDHQTLTRLMDQQVLTRAQTRWVRLGLFQSINPVIKYQPGKADIVANPSVEAKEELQMRRQKIVDFSEALSSRKRTQYMH